MSDNQHNNPSRIENTDRGSSSSGTTPPGRELPTKAKSAPTIHGHAASNDAFKQTQSDSKLPTPKTGSLTKSDGLHVAAINAIKVRSQLVGSITSLLPTDDSENGMKSEDAPSTSVFPSTIGTDTRLDLSTQLSKSERMQPPTLTQEHVQASSAGGEGASHANYHGNEVRVLFRKVTVHSSLSDDRIFNVTAESTEVTLGDTPPKSFLDDGTAGDKAETTTKALNAEEHIQKEADTVSDTLTSSEPSAGKDGQIPPMPFEAATGVLPETHELPDYAETKDFATGEGVEYEESISTEEDAQSLILFDTPPELQFPPPIIISDELPSEILEKLGLKLPKQDDSKALFEQESRAPYSPASPSGGLSLTEERQGDLANTPPDFDENGVPSDIRGPFSSATSPLNSEMTGPEDVWTRIRYDIPVTQRAIVMKAVLPSKRLSSTTSLSRATPHPTIEDYYSGRSSLTATVGEMSQQADQLQCELLDLPGKEGYEDTRAAHRGPDTEPEKGASINTSLVPRPDTDLVRLLTECKKEHRPTQEPEIAQSVVPEEQTMLEIDIESVGELSKLGLFFYPDGTEEAEHEFRGTENVEQVEADRDNVGEAEPAGQMSTEVAPVPQKVQRTVSHEETSVIAELVEHVIKEAQRSDEEPFSETQSYEVLQHDAITPGSISKEVVNGEAAVAERRKQYQRAESIQSHDLQSVEEGTGAGPSQNEGADSDITSRENNASMPLGLGPIMPNIEATSTETVRNAGERSEPTKTTVGATTPSVCTEVVALDPDARSLAVVLPQIVSTVEENPEDKLIPVPSEGQLCPAPSEVQLCPAPSEVQLCPAPLEVQLCAAPSAAEQALVEQHDENQRKSTPIDENVRKPPEPKETPNASDHEIRLGKELAASAPFSLETSEDFDLREEGFSTDPFDAVPVVDERVSTNQLASAHDQQPTEYTMGAIEGETIHEGEEYVTKDIPPSITTKGGQPQKATSGTLLHADDTDHEPPSQPQQPELAVDTGEENVRAQLQQQIPPFEHSATEPATLAQDDKLLLKSELEKQMLGSARAEWSSLTAETKQQTDTKSGSSPRKEELYEEPQEQNSVLKQVGPELILGSQDNRAHIDNKDKALPLKEEHISDRDAHALPLQSYLETAPLRDTNIEVDVEDKPPVILPEYKKSPPSTTEVPRVGPHEPQSPFKYLLIKPQSSVPCVTTSQEQVPVTDEQGPHSEIQQQPGSETGSPWKQHGPVSPDQPISPLVSQPPTELGRAIYAVASGGVTPSHWIVERRDDGGIVIEIPVGTAAGHVWDGAGPSQPKDGIFEEAGHETLTPSPMRSSFVPEPTDTRIQDHESTQPTAHMYSLRKSGENIQIPVQVPRHEPSKTTQKWKMPKSRKPPHKTGRKRKAAYHSTALVAVDMSPPEFHPSTSSLGSHFSSETIPHALSTKYLRPSVSEPQPSVVEQHSETNLLEQISPLQQSSSTSTSSESELQSPAPCPVPQQQPSRMHKTATVPQVASVPSPGSFAPANVNIHYSLPLPPLGTDEANVSQITTSVMQSRIPLPVEPSRLDTDSTHVPVRRDRDIDQQQLMAVTLLSLLLIIIVVFFLALSIVMER